jgi:hypothetical protein
MFCVVPLLFGMGTITVKTRGAQALLSEKKLKAGALACGSTVTFTDFLGVP